MTFVPSKLTMRFILIVLAAFTFMSCKKQICTSNCGTIKIAGRVMNASNNKGVANVLVRAGWRMAGLCYVCSGPDAGSCKTDPNGYFSFDLTTDTTRFGDYCLQVRAELPDHYISFDNEDDRLIKTSFTRSNLSSIDDIHFLAYEKATLRIKLERQQNDQFTELLLYSKYNQNYTNELGLTAQPQKMEKVIETAANVFTKIRCDKWNDYFLQSSSEDSIRCQAGKENVLVLRY
jgi:hypothetical protein